MEHSNWLTPFSIAVVCANLIQIRLQNSRCNYIQEEISNCFYQSTHGRWETRQTHLLSSWQGRVPALYLSRLSETSQQTYENKEGHRIWQDGIRGIQRTLYERTRDPPCWQRQDQEGIPSYQCTNQTGTGVTKDQLCGLFEGWRKENQSNHLQHLDPQKIDPDSFWIYRSTLDLSPRSSTRFKYFVKTYNDHWLFYQIYSIRTFRLFLNIDSSCLAKYVAASYPVHNIILECHDFWIGHFSSNKIIHSVEAKRFHSFLPRVSGHSMRSLYTYHT